jgi:DNA-binding transcriptional MerR regulator
MYTVTKLARECGLSRSTLLYYESIGLLKQPPRTAGNYRSYGEKELERLRQICVFREAGLKLEDIGSILDRPTGDASAILKRRLKELNVEIEALRLHQKAIFRLLRVKYLSRRNEVITKEKWVAIMKAAGFTEEEMRGWHKEFERQAPQEHQEFLEFLHIPAAEIATIREWSRKPAGA